MYQSKTSTKIQFAGAVGLVAAVVMGGPAYGEPISQASDPWFLAGQARLVEALQTKPNKSVAKNVIVFIGDGMGVSSFTAGRIWQGQQSNESGEENLLSWEKFPHVAMVKTYNTNQQIADSAGTATAWNSGVKAQAGMIGGDSTVQRGDCSTLIGHHATTLLELAEMAGKSTGTVSTARLTHATPAATYSHSSDRDFEDDGKLAKAWKDPTGCKDIARQLIEFPFGDGIEVAMGGGRRHFRPNTTENVEKAGQKNKRKDGRDLTVEWVNNYSSKNPVYVWNQAQFDAINVQSTNAVLGLFNNSHMQYEADRTTKDVGGEPSIAEMTSKAIDILSKNNKGFFLQVEAGRIDHANHLNNAYRMVADTAALSDAVAVALQKVDLNHTLIIVTADHSHVFTIAGYAIRGNPILGKSRGTTKKGGGPDPDGLAKAIDGKPYTTVGYGNGPGAWKDGTKRPDVTTVNTNDVDYIQQATWARSSETHAGEDVTIWAAGPGAWLFQGTVEQNYIFHVIDYAARLRQKAGQL